MSEINKLLVVTIFPFSYPDQVCIYAAEECKRFIETFFTYQIVFMLQNTSLGLAELDLEEEKDEERRKRIREE